jgi:anti-sigma factor RsiW
MSCERYEKELALSVEGDLPASQVAVLEQHVASCERCRAFQHGLEASQGALKSLAEEPLDDDALAAVRTRVLTTVAQTARPSWNTTHWAWPALASAALLLLVAMFWLVRGATTTRPATRAATAVPAATPLPTASLTAQSTQHTAPAVSQSVRTPKKAPVPRLSPEDAEQLARAVVATSRVERLGLDDAAETDRPALASAPLTRIASDDPNVVIYWQYDSNGG